MRSTSIAAAQSARRPSLFSLEGWNTATTGGDGDTWWRSTVRTLAARPALLERPPATGQGRLRRP